MSATINIKNLKGRVNFLSKGFQKSLDNAAQDTVNHLMAMWIKGKGGDELSMKGLSEPYKTKKSSGKVKVGNTNHGGQPIPNLWLTGNMAKSMPGSTKKPSPTQRIIGFADGEKNKARGNYRHRPNMMYLSERFKKKILKNIYLDLVRTGAIN